MMPVALVCWGVCASGDGYRVATFDDEGEHLVTVEERASKRGAERKARALARYLSVPVRESGKAPEVWAKAIRRWVKC